MRKRLFSNPETRLSTKKYKILMNGFRYKCKEPVYLGILDQKGQFCTVFFFVVSKIGKTGFFQKKRLEHFVSVFQFKLTVKYQDKVMK